VSILEDSSFEEFVYKVYVPDQFFGLLIQVGIQKVTLPGLREPLTLHPRSLVTQGKDIVYVYLPSIEAMYPDLAKLSNLLSPRLRLRIYDQPL
jgi:hypothetical protein